VHNIVYTIGMKNITLSAREAAIEKARQVAAKKHTTLNNLFREWLETLDRQPESSETEHKLETLWSQTNYLRVGRKLNRDDMHER
jgi:hypothetical protein